MEGKEEEEEGLVHKLAKYKLEDVVVCQYATEMYYEGKVVEISTEMVDDERVYKYLVHYKGWSKRFDEWLIEPLVFPVTEDKLEKLQQKPGKRKVVKGPAKKEKRSEEIVEVARPAAADQPPPAKRKRGRPKTKGVQNEESESETKSSPQPQPSEAEVNEEKSSEPVAVVESTSTPATPAQLTTTPDIVLLSQVEEEAGESSSHVDKQKPPVTAAPPEPKTKVVKPAKRLAPVERKVKTKLPKGKIYLGRHFQLGESLVNCLNEDAEQIETYKRVTTIPPDFSVRQIVEEYYDFRSSKEVNDLRRKRVERFKVSLINSFNVHAPVCLLYEFEKLQYARLHNQFDGLDLADVYSFPHLLRYIMKVEELMQDVSMQAEYRDQAFNVLMADFIRFLTRNVNKYFDSSALYIDNPPAYHRMAYC